MVTEGWPAGVRPETSNDAASQGSLLALKLADGGAMFCQPARFAVTNSV